MGNELTRLRSESFRQSRQLAGCTFTVNGGSTSYAGVLSSGQEMKLLGEGGFLTDFDKALDYLPSDVALVVGDKVTISGTTYRVQSLNGDGEPIYTATLATVNK